MTGTAPPLSHVVRRDHVPQEGLTVAIEADEETREALAAFLGIPAVEAFRAEATVERWRRDGLCIRGRIDGRVAQTCVVTLQPVHNDIAETFEDYYTPDSAAIGKDMSAAADPEDIEPLVDERVDFAALAVEHLVLALDPYPRCEGVEFEPEAQQEDDTAETKPFAALAALRRDPAKG